MKANQVILIGYVGADLTTQQLQAGTKRVAIRVATHYKTINKEGEQQNHTVWHNVVAWDHTALYAERNFVKGSHIMVEGCIDYSNFVDKNGYNRYSTIIKANSLVNLDR